MNLNLCIDKWIDHIDILILKGSSYGSQALRGFKEGKNTNDSFQWLDTYFKAKDSAFELTVNNFETILIDLILDCDPALLSRNSFQYLRRCTLNKKLISLDLSNLQDEETNELILPKIIDKLDAARNRYDDLIGDDPQPGQSAINNTQSSQNIISLTLPTYMTDSNNNLLDELRLLKDSFNTKLESLNSKITNLALNNGYNDKTFNQLISILGYRLKKLLLADHGIVIQDYHLNVTNNSCPSQLSVKNFFRTI